MQTLGTTMTRHYRANIAILVFSGIIGHSALSADDGQRNATDRLLDEINAMVEAAILEVVDDTMEKAKKVVDENTGVDLQKRGYRPKEKHTPLPSAAGDEARRELRQLAEKHDRKIHHLEHELDKKLAQARHEFEREASKEHKVKKVREKRTQLTKKVDEAYAKFDEKVSAENRRFDEKRDKILDREIGWDHRRPAKDGTTRHRGEDSARHDGTEIAWDGSPERGDRHQYSPARADVTHDDIRATGPPHHDEEKSKRWWEIW